MPNVIIETSRGFAATDAVGVTVNNTTVETTLFSQVIRGKAFGTVKRMEFRLVCTITTLLTAPTLTLKVKYGNSSFTLVTTAGLSLSMTGRPFIIDGEIVAKNSANAQSVNIIITQDSLGVITGLTGANAASTDWTEDSTVDATFSVTAQFGTLSAGTTLVCKNGMVEMS